MQAMRQAGLLCDVTLVAENLEVHFFSCDFLGELSLLSQQKGARSQDGAGGMLSLLLCHVHRIH